MKRLQGRQGVFQKSNRGKIMVRYAIAFVLAITTGAGLAFANGVDDKQLQGEALHNAVAGKTVYLATPLGALPIRFRIDGTMLGRAGDLAYYTGSAQDKGRWWVAAEKLCQRWEPPDHQEKRSRISKRL